VSKVGHDEFESLIFLSYEVLDRYLGVLLEKKMFDQWRSLQ